MLLWSCSFSRYLWRSWTDNGSWVMSHDNNWSWFKLRETAVPRNNLSPDPLAYAFMRDVLKYFVNGSGVKRVLGGVTTAWPNLSPDPLAIRVAPVPLMDLGSSCRNWKTRASWPSFLVCLARVRNANCGSREKQQATSLPQSSGKLQAKQKEKNECN